MLSHMCRNQRTCEIWAAALLTALGSAPERPGEHLAPAYRLVAELCTLQHSEAGPAAITARDSAGSEAGSPPVASAVSPCAEEQISSPQSAAGSAEASGERPDAQADGMRLVGRLLMQRLSDAHLRNAQPTASADQQVRTKPPASAAHAEARPVCFGVSGRQQHGTCLV